MFEILFGIPEIQARWDNLIAKKENKSITSDELSLLKNGQKPLLICPQTPNTQAYKLMR